MNDINEENYYTILSATTTQVTMEKAMLLNVLVYLAIFSIILISALVFVALHDRNK